MHIPKDRHFTRLLEVGNILNNSRTMPHSFNVGQRDSALRSVWAPVVKVLVSCLLILLVFRRTDLSSVIKSLEHVSKSKLGAVIFVTAGLAPLVFAARWRVLSEELITYSQALKFTWIGFFFSALLPGVISADVAKGLSLAALNQSARTAQLPASIFLDRMVGGIVLIATFAVSCAYLDFGAVSMSQTESIHRFAEFGFLFSLVSISMFIVLRTYWALSVVRNIISTIGARYRWHIGLLALLESLSGKLHERGLITRALLLGVASQTLLVLQTWLLLRSLGVTISVSDTVIIQACISIGTMLPISFSGIGVREWLTVILFPTMHLTQSLAVAFSWLCLGCSLLLALGGGVVQMYALLARSKTSKDMHS
jgi:uncharacterized protein (TIRG00374 family)